MGPIAAGHLLGWRMPLTFVAMLLAGCAAMAVLLRHVEGIIPARANGVVEQPATRP